ncbi:MAG TPA: hypothetical protein VNJ08_09250 [Bacteriovoracaceae bacterium]|nr:hypothetical protein [Bacteriovoracaceae bacterium]
MLILPGQSLWAQIRDFQTTRLNSTAGAGVASILSTEAAILNPASSAFFDGSSFSYQTYDTALRKKSAARTAAADDFPKQNRTTGMFVSDHSGPVKGGVAYLQQNENNFERERYTAHGSMALSTNASLGLRYSFLQDQLPTQYSDHHKTHHQASIGGTFIIDEDTVLGLVVIDPTRTNQGDERAIAGFQYDVADRFIVIGDVGTRYTKNVKEKYLWRAAVQINIFSDLFIRAGRFYDNVTEFKGSGWGVSWIGPRLGLEFAQKISDKFGDSNYVYKDETLVDTSLSAILKF